MAIYILTALEIAPARGDHLEAALNAATPHATLAGAKAAAEAEANDLAGGPANLTWEETYPGELTADLPFGEEGGWRFRIRELELGA